MCQKGNTIACRLVPFFSVLYIGISLFVMLPTLAYACGGNGDNNSRPKIPVNDPGANGNRPKIPVNDPGANGNRPKIPVNDPGGQTYGIYTIQLMRPDPNRPESQGQTVQSVQMSYFYQFPVDAPEQHTCIETPDQNWHLKNTRRILKFGSNVKFEVFAGSGCTGNDETQRIYGQSFLHFQVPNNGDIKNATCWMNINNFFNGTVSGCNGS